MQQPTLHDVGAGSGIRKTRAQSLAMAAKKKTPDQLAAIAEQNKGAAMELHKQKTMMSTMNF